jgi:hypothetical protein
MFVISAVGKRIGSYAEMLVGQSYMFVHMKVGYMFAIS